MSDLSLAEILLHLSISIYEQIGLFTEISSKRFFDVGITRIQNIIDVKGDSNNDSVDKHTEYHFISFSSLNALLPDMKL
jgi:hypothetical protein